MLGTVGRVSGLLPCLLSMLLSLASLWGGDSGEPPTCPYHPQPALTSPDKHSGDGVSGGRLIFLQRAPPATPGAVSPCAFPAPLCLATQGVGGHGSPHGGGDGAGSYAAPSTSETQAS